MLLFDYKLFLEMPPTTPGLAGMFSVEREGGWYNDWY